MPVILTFQYSRPCGRMVHRWCTRSAGRPCVWLIRLTEFNHRVPVRVSRTARGERKKKKVHIITYVLQYYLSKDVYCITSRLKWINKKSCARSEMPFIPLPHPPRHRATKTHSTKFISGLIVWRTGTLASGRSKYAFHVGTCIAYETKDGQVIKKIIHLNTSS